VRTLPQSVPAARVGWRYSVGARSRSAVLPKWNWRATYWGVSAR